MPEPTVTATVAAFFAKKTGILAAGLIGAAVSLRFVQHGLSIKARVFNVICGVACANYGAIPIAAYFDILEHQEAFGFLVGLFGLSLCTAIFRAVDEADLWAFIKDKFSFGGKNDNI